MKSISQLIDASRFKAVAFQESEAMKSLQQLTEASMSATKAFRESGVMQSISQLTDANRLTALAFQESEAAKRIRALIENQFSSLRVNDLYAQNQFSKLAAFDALKVLENSPFKDLYKTGFFDYEKHHHIVDILDRVIHEVDNETIDDINSKTDFNTLTDKTKKILLYIFHFYILPLVLNYCYDALTTSNALEARMKLQAVSNQREVKQFVKSPSSNFDRSMLKGYRVTTANNLSFRASPNIKSDVVESLPIGTLVKVISKDHSKSWLLVEVEFDGELEQGWISRRYTTYFK
jgi:hypothetical protein